MRQRIAEGPSYKRWAFAAVAIGTFVSVVDHGSVIVALPTIAEHFDTDLPTAQWVIVGYTLAISALLLPMGRLSDMIGRKRVYVGGFVVFVVGAALAGSSTDITTLIAFKTLQGIGAAMSQSCGMAILISIFPSHKRGSVLGSHMSVVGAGSVIGPALGGILVGSLGWEWVFFIHVPVGILAALVAIIVLDERGLTQPGPRTTFDWLGAAASSAALIIMLLVLTTGSNIGWASPAILVGAVGAIAMLAAFIWWELRTTGPMLDLRLFKRKLFSFGVSVGFISFFGGSSSRFLMPFYLQKVLGFSAMQVGLILVPAALTMIMTGPVSGRLSDRYGWRKFNVGGLSLIAVGLFILSGVTQDSPLGLAMAGMMVQSAGMGIFQSPNNSSILSTVERSRYGVVSALTQLIRNSATVTSVVVTTAIVTAAMASEGYPPSLEAVSDAPHAFLSGLRTAFLVMGGLLLLGVVVSFFKGERAEGVMGPVSQTHAGETPLD